MQISVHLGIPDMLVDPKIGYEPQKAEVDIRVQCIREEVPHQRAPELQSRWHLVCLETMLDANNDIWIVNLEKEPVWNCLRNCTDIVGMESTEPNHEGDAERFGKRSRKKNKRQGFWKWSRKKERKKKDSNDHWLFTLRAVQEWEGEKSWIAESEPKVGLSGGKSKEKLHKNEKQNCNTTTNYKLQNVNIFQRIKHNFCIRIKQKAFTNLARKLGGNISDKRRGQLDAKNRDRVGSLE